MEIGKEIPEGKAAGLRSPWPPRLWALSSLLGPSSFSLASLKKTAFPGSLGCMPQVEPQAAC